MRTDWKSMKIDWKVNRWWCLDLDRNKYRLWKLFILCVFGRFTRKLEMTALKNFKGCAYIWARFVRNRWWMESYIAEKRRKKYTVQTTKFILHAHCAHQRHTNRNAFWNIKVASVCLHTTKKVFCLVALAHFLYTLKAEMQRLQRSVQTHEQLLAELLLLHLKKLTILYNCDETFNIGQKNKTQICEITKILNNCGNSYDEKTKKKHMNLWNSIFQFPLRSNS